MYRETRHVCGVFDKGYGFDDALIVWLTKGSGTS